MQALLCTLMFLNLSWVHILLIGAYCMLHSFMKSHTNTYACIYIHTHMLGREATLASSPPGSFLSHLEKSQVHRFFLGWLLPFQVADPRKPVKAGILRVSAQCLVTYRFCHSSLQAHSPSQWGKALALEVIKFLSFCFSTIDLYMNMLWLPRSRAFNFSAGSLVLSLASGVNHKSQNYSAHGCLQNMLYHFLWVSQ